MELDSSDTGDAWMFDAMSTSLLLSAASPPLPSPWPCGDNKQHPSTPPDTAHLDDDDPGASIGNWETNEGGKYFNGKCQAVNLSNTDVVEHPYVLICNERHQVALVEILETLTVTCEKFKLPLAQTWVPCKYQNLLTHCHRARNGHINIHRSCVQESCMSTSDVAFNVVDARMWGFRDACVEHHLQKGQGVSGKAIILRRPCFSRDITRFSKVEYPLVHYARMFGLSGCFSVCLQSAYIGNDDYVLEFFLPPDCRYDDEQKLLLESILALLRQHLRSLQVASDDGSSEAYLQVDAITVIDYEDNTHARYMNLKSAIHPSHESDIHTIQEPDSRKVKSSIEYKKHLLPENKSKGIGKLFSGRSDCTSDSSLVDLNNKHLGRRRGKAEKKISLDVIQQYFSGSLKSAAKSLGVPPHIKIISISEVNSYYNSFFLLAVCPTTMKRICRQHGISRWPSRQIRKVNRSISKLKKVIESVEGPESAFNLTSIKCHVPVSYHQLSTLNIENERQNKVTLSIPFAQEYNGSSSHNKPLENDLHLGTLEPRQKPLVDISSQVEAIKASYMRSSSVEPSAHLETSEESCHEGLDTVVLTLSKPQQNRNKPDEFKEHPSQEQNTLQRLFIKDSECSQDFRNHTISTVTQPTVVRTGNLMLVQNSEIVTVKARYKEDILRFRFRLSGSIVTLKDEVAKRIHMDVGVFDIKYLDDDNDWVNLTCNADLAECMEIFLLSGSNALRLLVTDIAVNIGSSCGSTG
ncbi:hypothetical protein PR202_ga11646 [Eleusine coracana subsp. coracana]|uniref:Uncharacterized protein n=1 Tax=Eleusine coracana subsp. coracana TaxID=191504 RepID=A0AAV5CA43_ELECO|nr:hypothetical protein PR202_ga11646 [Eleusine coracana subsp. coracana]